MSTVATWDGAVETPAEVTVWDGASERPAQLGVMPYGAGSVDELLARPGFTIAHRGGTLDWPEMSMRAYTESVRRRVDAVEVSVGRTVDGVWFGLHDDTLLRTSGVNVDHRTLTWAQIQAYLIQNTGVSPDPAFGPQPHMLLTDLLAAYASSHVIFVDPKYHAGVQWQPEFYDLIESVVPDANQHIVIKAASGSTAAADGANARGYVSFGSFYQDEYAADPAGSLEDAQRWAWINLQHIAPQATWDTFAALGKPMTGHIAQTPAEYDTAMAKGAIGVMCNGIRAIKGAPAI